MRNTQYKMLMEHLDAGLRNGYEEILEQEPAEIFEEIVDQTGTRWFDNVPADELHQAIRGWQVRNED